MKKPNLRKLYLFLLISVLVISFTSCENEDYTKTGKLVSDTYDWQYQPQTNNVGTVTVTLDMDIRDIQGYNTYDRLYQIDLYNSFLTMDSKYMGTGDEVEIRLWSYGIGEYRNIYKTDNRGITQISSDYDTSYRRFIQDLMDKLYSDGHLTLDVSVRVNRYQIIPFDLELNNNLDLRIRD